MTIHSRKPCSRKMKRSTDPEKRPPQGYSKYPFTFFSASSSFSMLEISWCPDVLTIPGRIKYGARFSRRLQAEPPTHPTCSRRRRVRCSQTRRTSRNWLRSTRLRTGRRHRRRTGSQTQGQGSPQRLGQRWARGLHQPLPARKKTMAQAWGVALWR